MRSRLASPRNKALVVMLIAWASLLITYGLPSIELSTTFSEGVIQWTRTGGVAGSAFVSVMFIGLLVFRRSLAWRRRWQEILIHIVILAVLQGGGALINEQGIKRAVAMPRPNIVWLADQDALGMTARQFYTSMNARERRSYLEHVLEDPGFHVITLTEEVRDHWIHETGYSFPSGHAFSAMLSATYFLAMGMSLIADRRRFIFYVLPVWALLVAWSRVLLRVHRPFDVVIGGLLGIVLAVLAYELARRWLDKGRGRATS
ncbi:phosphatase PAP2 family protein [Candidatus Bipolaricaulota bacterium]|nr:phosphatase PAP2 family protein [Candidatus Bipolaricaulota bacterium]